MPKDKRELISQHYLGNTAYDQLICFLHIHMGDDYMIALLEQATAENKKIVYRDDLMSEEEKQILDFFDDRLIELQ